MNMATVPCFTKIGSIKSWAGACARTANTLVVSIVGGDAHLHVDGDDEVAAIIRNRRVVKRLADLNQCEVTFADFRSRVPRR